VVFSLSVAAQRAQFKTPATPENNLLHFPRGRNRNGTSPRNRLCRRSIHSPGDVDYSARINKQQSYRTHEEQPQSRRRHSLA